MSGTDARLRKCVSENAAKASMPSSSTASERNLERIPSCGPAPHEPTSGDQIQVLTCPVCGMAFNSRDRLQMHIDTAHPENPNSDEM